MNTKAFKRITSGLALYTLVAALIGSACSPAVAPHALVNQSTRDAAGQQTLAALRGQLNQTATAEKNVLLQQATSVFQTQTAAVTAGPTNTITPTPNLLETQQASMMLSRVQQYARDNLLPSSSGAYQRLNDQILYYSKAGYFKRTDTGMLLDDFAFESDLAWENTTETIGDVPAGCGFVFHSDGSKNFTLAYLGIDGYVYIEDLVNNVWHPLSRVPFGKVDVPEGKAHIALVVSGIHYVLLVNDKIVAQSQSAADQQKTGQFAYVVFSGSDKGVGTTCKFTNIDLWTVKP